MASRILRKSFVTIFAIAIIFIIAVYIGYELLKPNEQLPIYNPSDVNPRLVDFSIQHKKVDHKVADFKLINQNGEEITNETYNNKIYVADFFFTRCTRICPMMTTNMAALQEYFKKDDEVMFLSHSVTPIMDSVPILKQYAQNKGVIDGKWHITTGNKKHIYNLARKSYFAVLDEGDGGDQDFIHTDQFILIDAKRQIRGYYNGTDEKEIALIIKDIEVLKKE